MAASDCAGDESAGRSAGLPRGVWIVRRLASIAALGILLGTVGCATRYTHFVRVVHDGEAELGVATDQGILFTGRNVREGDVELVFSFQSDELFSAPGTVVRYVENLGLIKSPARFLPLTVSDRNPTPDDSVQIAGLSADGDCWYLSASVPEETDITGSVVRCDSLWDLSPNDIAGASVLIWRDESWQLVGLVWGRVDFRGEHFVAYADLREISRVFHDSGDYLEHPDKVYLRGINTTPDY